MKRITLILIINFSILIHIFGQIRYEDDLPGNVISHYQTYITYPLSTCWKNGNKPKVNELMKNNDPYLYNPSNIPILTPGSSPNNKCFNYFEMYSIKDTYNINDTTVDLGVKIFELENDTLSNRKVIIYLSAAQGFFDMPILGGGLRYWDKINDNPNDITAIKKQDEAICQYLAQKGYLVLAIDMRKGWDIKGITNMNATPELLTYWYHNYCECEGSCDSYSLLESNYRNIQDLLAAYGFLLNNKLSLRINPNGISMLGSSSGSYFAMLAGFALDDYPYLKVPKSNNSTTNITLFEKFGSPFRYFNNDSTLFKIEKIIGLSSAIADTNWIELSDSINFVNNEKFPIYIMQSTNDNVFINCGGQMRKAKYNNVLDENLYFFGGGAVHDRIMHLGGTKSHLVTQMAMKHGGLFNYHQFHCYNTIISDKCFDNQNIYEEMKAKTATMLYYPIKKPNDYIHVVIGAHKKDDIINGYSCNLCDFTILAKPDSLGEHYLSSCNYDIDILFGNDYYTNIVTAIENPTYHSIEDLKIYPNLSSTFVKIKYDKAWENSYLSIIIVDLLGKPILNEKKDFHQNELQIDVSQLPKGIYFVQIKNENEQPLGQGKIIVP